MDFLQTVEKIEDLIRDSVYDKRFILSLYRSLFTKINPYEKPQFDALIKVSDSLINHLLKKHDYTSVLKIYKIEHEYFYTQFNDEYSKKLENIISEDTISEKGLKNILDYLLISFDVIINRWKQVIEKIEELSANNSELKNIITNEMKPLLLKANFHVIHSVHFIRHNYNELEKVYKKISELSLIDPLTGLKNRRYFYMTYENIFFMASRRKMSICFVMLDIDNFKQINDKYGHQKGDEVLIKIALVVSNFFRRSDIIVRYGGDEILIMLSDAKKYDVKILISQLLEKIRTLRFLSDNKSFNITLSAGIYCKKIESCIKPTLLMNKMIKKADEAMYQSKKEGKDQVTVYEDNS